MSGVSWHRNVPAHFRVDRGISYPHFSHGASLTCNYCCYNAMTMGLKSSGVKVALLFIVAILLSVAALGQFPGNHTMVIAQVLSGSPTNATVSIRVSTEVDCELDPLTHVFFDITPADGAEVAVMVGDTTLHFGTSENDESGVDEYFPNGTYEANISARMGYAVDGQTKRSFVVQSTCSDVISTPLVPVLVAPTTTTATPPAPLPPPTTITPDETAIKSPLTPTPETDAAEPLSSTALLLSSPKTEAIVTCDSNESCAKTCGAGGAGACNDYTTEKLLPVSPVENIIDPAVIVVFLEERQGARVFVDSDSDGITNYDEVNIYHTNPKESDTNGNGISDGAELLLGTNPLSTSTSNAITFEDPHMRGATTSELAVSSIVPSATTSDADGTVHATAVKFSGHAPANSFVTLYIYSEPIVATVKTDDTGTWVYTLDKELPDGNHEVVTAIADLGGHVLARSEPLSFVKKAEAFTLGSSTPPPTAAPPSFFEGSSLMITSLFIVIALVSSFVVIVVVPQRKNDGDTPSGPEAPATTT